MRVEADVRIRPAARLAGAADRLPLAAAAFPRQRSVSPPGVVI
jgi:hypothetical protein